MQNKIDTILNLEFYIIMLHLLLFYFIQNSFKFYTSFYYNILGLYFPGKQLQTQISRCLQNKIKRKNTGRRQTPDGYTLVGQ